MNRAAFGNIQQPGALVLGELTLELQLAVDPVQLADPGFAVGAVAGVDAPMAQPHRELAQRPALAVGVHAYRDGGAGAKPGEQQVVGGGAAVGAAQGARLVALPVDERGACVDRLAALGGRGGSIGAVLVTPARVYSN